jgi:hypothetical protein
MYLRRSSSDPGVSDNDSPEELQFFLSMDFKDDSLLEYGQSPKVPARISRIVAGSSLSRSARILRTRTLVTGCFVRESTWKSRPLKAIRSLFLLEGEMGRKRSKQTV